MFQTFYCSNHKLDVGDHEIYVCDHKIYVILLRLQGKIRVAKQSLWTFFGCMWELLFSELFLGENTMNVTDHKIYVE